jgi:gamma-glutamyltranspeptidase/glutathione hydrolase
VLRDGGNAIEAMIAAAATVAVVYPHMNGLGGDGFWLIGRPGRAVEAIQACGRSAALASREWYFEQGHRTIPTRGPLAALTVAGAVSGWRAAHQSSHDTYGGRLPLKRLLEEAIRHAREGVAVTRSLHDNTAAKLAELAGIPGFAETYLGNGAPLPIAGRLRLERLAATLEHLGRAGLDDFYTGDLARSMSRDLEAVGSPIRLADLEAHRSEAVTPLSLEVAGHRLHNLPPPTQGLASLLVLALYAPRQAESPDGFDFVHRLVECTKAAFRVRDRHVSDPAWMSETAESFLTDASLARLGADISHDRAAPWPNGGEPGDTVWLGAADRSGLCVSYIQSIYWEFGSGVILPGTGITWQNRGASFSLEASHPNRLEPRRLPFHTIQPALAELADGSMMVYGTMGGEGQPQTQAAIFARHVMHGVPLQAAVTAPRWLLGRTWGAATTTLKIEDRFDPAVIDQLKCSGHDIEVVEGFADIMGHAGAIVLHPDGLMEGASDPRSDGAVAAR